MMSMETASTLSNTCEQLLHQRDYKRALQLLNKSKDDTFCKWLKARIYMQYAKYIADEPQKEGMTAEGKKEMVYDTYRVSMHYLREAGDSLPRASEDVKAFLRDCLWRDHCECYTKMARTRPVWLENEKEELELEAVQMYESQLNVEFMTEDFVMITLKEEEDSVYSPDIKEFECEFNFYDGTSDC